MRKILLLLVLFAVLAIPLYSVEVATYSSKLYDYQLTVPKAWRTYDTGQKTGVLVWFFDPKTSGEMNIANISVITEPLDVSFNVYVQKVRDNAPVFIKRRKILADRAVIVNGQAAHVIDVQFKQGNYLVKTKQLVIAKKDRVYVVTGACLTQYWEEYQPLLTTVVTSFK